MIIKAIAIDFRQLFVEECNELLYPVIDKWDIHRSGLCDNRSWLGPYIQHP